MQSFRCFSGLRAALCMIAVLLLAASPKARAQDTPFDPATTKVCVIPVVDRTGEKAADRRKFQSETGTQNFVQLFQDRGFQIVDAETVKAAIEKLKLNMDDEEDYRRENFYKVAKEVGADIVTFAIVTSTSNDVKNSPFKGKELQGRATVKIWLLDAKNEKPILSALVKEGKAAGKSNIFATNEGTNRRANAVGNAVKEATEEFFKPYPVVKGKNAKEGK